MLIGSHFIRTGRQAPPPGQAFTAGKLSLLPLFSCPADHGHEPGIILVREAGFRGRDEAAHCFLHRVVEVGLHHAADRVAPRFGRLTGRLVEISPAALAEPQEAFSHQDVQDGPHRGIGRRVRNGGSYFRYAGLPQLDDQLCDLPFSLAQSIERQLHRFTIMLIN